MNRWCPACDARLQYIVGFGEYHCYECNEDFSPADLETNDGLMSVSYEIHSGDQVEQESIQFFKKIDEETEMTELKRITDDASKQTFFPYNIADIKYWVVKRRTGETVRYTLTKDPRAGGTRPMEIGSRSSISDHQSVQSWAGSLSDWCKHDPTALPVFVSKDKKTELFICDAQGARAGKDKFDIIIDGGDVIHDLYASPKSGILSGDEQLAKSLASHNTAIWGGARTLKINWADRKAPMLHPKFWPDLAAKIDGRVMTCCQGGHGRSGTSLVCLMMVLNPEYDAYAAICHLRALHCARAIESAEQHGYIDEVADFLKREANSAKVKDVKSFKDAFLALNLASAKPYQARLLSEGAK